jgi:hypothetical protein
MKNEVFEHLKNIGICKEDFYSKLSSGIWIKRNIYDNEEQLNKIESIKHFAFASQTPETYYYYWSKPGAKFDEGSEVIDDRSRDFCVEMIGLGKLWSKQEINQLSFRLRYSVFREAGHHNCRHQWFAVQAIRDSKVLDRDKKKMVKSVNSPEDLYN